VAAQCGAQARGREGPPPRRRPDEVQARAGGDPPPGREGTNHLREGAWLVRELQDGNGHNEIRGRNHGDGLRSRPRDAHPRQVQGLGAVHAIESGRRGIGEQQLARRAHPLRQAAVQRDPAGARADLDHHRTRGPGATNSTKSRACCRACAYIAWR